MCVRAIVPAALVCVLLTAATPSPTPLGPAAPLQTLVQCVSPIGPPPPALARTFPHDANTVSNLCNVTINLTSCYVDGSACFVYGVPPLRQEILPAQSIIDGHGGIRFYPCQRGYDAVTEDGQPITTVSAMYRCARAPAAEVPPPCAVPDGPAVVVVPITPEYPDDARGAGTVEVTVLISLDDTGAIQAMRILQTSENGSIDDDALRVVRGTLYSPKIVACEGVPSTYRFVVLYR